MQESPPKPVAAPAALNSANSARLHGLDALRAVAMLLGVVLHACISYMHDPMPGLLWTARDNAAVSGSFDSLFWGIHGFRMPLFFLIAGFFSARLIDVRGTAGFLAHRRNRIGVPFLAASVVILPSLFYCCGYGWLIAGECTFREIQLVKFQADHIQSNLWGLGHLWFLEYLILYSLLLAAVRSSRFLNPAVRLISRLVDGVLKSPAKWPLLAVPPAAFLWINPLTVLGFHQAPFPDPLQWAYYGVFFIYGNRLYRFENSWSLLQRCSSTCLMCASLLGAGMLWMIQMSALGPMLAVTIALFACSASLGTWGLFLRLFNKQRPTMRYMADASYWIYLTSPPLIVLIQVNLMRVGGPAAVKFLTTIVLTTALCLATYHLFVRYSVLGRILHGRRTKERPALAPLPLPADPDITRRAA